MSVRKLSFDCVPQGMARSLAKTHKYLWKKIRDARFVTGPTRCQVCNADKADRTQLDGHEVWECRPDAIVLIEILFICKLCHDAVHLERLRAKRPSPEYLEAVQAHYCVQNGVSLAELQQDYAGMKKRAHEIFILYKGVPPPMNYGPFHAEAEAAQSRRRTDDDATAAFEQFPDHECPWDMDHAD